MTNKTENIYFLHYKNMQTLVSLRDIKKSYRPQTFKRFNLNEPSLSTQVRVSLRNPVKVPDCVFIVQLFDRGQKHTTMEFY